MRLCDAGLPARLLVTLCSVLLAHLARAQSCPLEESVLFVVRTVYEFDDGFLNPHQDDPPPATNGAGLAFSWQIPTTRRTTFALPADAWREFENFGSCGNGHLSANLVARTQAIAALTDPMYAGGNQHLVVDIYIRGEPGTPFFVRTEARAQLVARRSDGGSESNIHAYFNGQLTPSMNATHVIGPQSTFTSGCTTDRRPPGGPSEYTFGTSVTFEVGGHTFHTGLCPFCSQVDRTYSTEARAQVELDAGVGRPACTGRIEVDLAPCQINCTTGTAEGTKRMDMYAFFEPMNGGSCADCRYEQYVRRLEGWVEIDRCSTGPIVTCHHELEPLPPSVNAYGNPRIGPCNAIQGQSKNGPCLVEDSTCSTNPECVGASAYGDRAEMRPACIAEDTYYTPSPGNPRDGTANRTDGCAYHGVDYPGGEGSMTSDRRTLHRRIEFEGRIRANLVRGNCPTNFLGTVVVAKKQWTICCDWSYGGGQQCTASECSEGNLNLPATVPVVFNLAGRTWTASLWRQGRLLRGTIGIPMAPGEAPRLSDVGVSMQQGERLEYVDEVLPRSGDSLLQYAICPIGFLTECTPRMPTITISYAGDTATIMPDLSAIVTPQADVDDGSGTGTRDGGVTIDDLLYYLAEYAAGGATADFDDGSELGYPDGGVTIDDLLYFLGRYSLGC